MPAHSAASSRAVPAASSLYNRMALEWSVCAAAVLLCPQPRPPLGLSMLLLVLLFLAQHGVYFGFDNRLRFLMLQSCCLVLPDLMLVRLGKLDFPETGLFYWSLRAEVERGVPDFMAGLWMIPLLFNSVIAERHGNIVATLAGCVLFWAAEASTDIWPVWRAQRADMLIGGLARYLLVPLAVLTRSTLEAEALARSQGWLMKVVIALANAGLYALFLRLALWAAV
jgi:hypothetical protein